MTRGTFWCEGCRGVAERLEHNLVVSPPRQDQVDLLSRIAGSLLDRVEQREWVCLGVVRQPADEQHRHFVGGDTQSFPPICTLQRRGWVIAVGVHTQRYDLKPHPHPRLTANPFSEVVGIRVGGRSHHSEHRV